MLRNDMYMSIIATPIPGAERVTTRRSLTANLGMRDESSTIASVEELQSRSRNVNWYKPKLEEVPQAFREVLEQYSGIPPDQVQSHVFDVREKAWDIFPYPCIGHFRFLTLTLHTTPSYPSILSRLRSNPSTSILLDLGCCFGQELRRLLHDGAPASTLYGADLRPEFFDLGYELFRDGGPKTTGNGMKFIAADVFAPHSALDALDGRCDVVHASAFFHLFGLEKQKQVARRVVRLLKWNGDASEGERPIVLGRHVGAVVAGEYEHSTNEGGVMFRHNVESWREMWEGVGEELGMRFVVEGDLRTTDVFRVNNKDGEGREKEKEDAGIRQLWFCVTRME